MELSFSYPGIIIGKFQLKTVRFSGDTSVPEWVQSFARACVDAGAGVFVSHGAPVLQPVEIYRGVPIFYGLGNFLFHLNEGEVVWSAPEVWKSVVATCRFDANARLRSIDLQPIVIGGDRLEARNYHERIVPIPAPADLAAEIIEDLAARSHAHCVSISFEANHGKLSPVEPSRALRACADQKSGI
ncbi:CapA family protein [Labrys neptuniae]|uniref:CapA family protein n=1 Tax=Labrys neptuniae TaxID=376174 RepID=UPI003F5AC683